MSGHDRPRRVELTARAEQVDREIKKLKIDRSSQDKRTGAQYHADLADQTERQLRRSPSWRAGRPLADHRGQCDCPATLAGCVERRSWPTSTDLGSRNTNNPDAPSSPPVIHGRPSSYSHGCRCQECRDAAAGAQRARRARRAVNAAIAAGRLERGDER